MRRIYPAQLFSLAFLRALGLLPTEYLFFCYEQSKALQNQQRAGATRGEELRILNAELIEVLRSDIASGNPGSAIAKYKAYMNRRNASYMGLDGAGESALDGQDPGWDPFEGATGYHRIAVAALAEITPANLPEVARGLTVSVKAYERMAIRAAARRYWHWHRTLSYGNGAQPLHSGKPSRKAILQPFRASSAGCRDRLLSCNTTFVNLSLTTGTITDSQRELYHKVIQEASRRGIHFAAGGSLALAYHASLSRCFKDLDLYVLPEEKDSMIAILNEAGLEDYHDRAPYDRGWIYRGASGDVIVDVIWAMANRRASVDLDWLDRGPIVDFSGLPLRLMPLEEMIWTKLYVLQRDRCDWPDLINVLDTASERIDWQYLLRRTGEDAALLAAVVRVFCWLKPYRIGSFPESVWAAFSSTPTVHDPELTALRAALLDSRSWLTSAESNR